MARYLIDYDPTGYHSQPTEKKKEEEEEEGEEEKNTHTQVKFFAIVALRETTRRYLRLDCYLARPSVS